MIQNCAEWLLLGQFMFITVYTNYNYTHFIESIIELGDTQILETVQYFIKYHGLNNYYGILINTFMYPVRYGNNFSQVTSV